MFTAHHSAVGAAVDGGELQRRERVDDAVVAVRDAQQAGGEVVLAARHGALHHALHVHVATCAMHSAPHQVPAEVVAPWLSRV